MKKHPRTATGWCVAFALSALLTACGGGGSDVPPPTAIPDNLAISAPGSAEAGAPIRFANSAAALTGLKYSWDFGDGSVSAEALPSHSYADGGQYEVVLKVTNEAGLSREIRSKVTITHIANVRGLVCTGADSTGWCWQNPRPTGNRVNSVFFLDANLGWRAGDRGEIFKTTDGGATWVMQQSGVGVAIYGIAFRDAQHGWATGAFGALLRTSDGGTTWQMDRLLDAGGMDFDASVITPVDASTVYIGRLAVGGASAVFVSTDAGATWRQSVPAPAAVLKGGTLWAVEDDVVKRSVDGGKSYVDALRIQRTPNHTIESIRFVARDELRAAVLVTQTAYSAAAQRDLSEYSVSSTQDGGVTWRAVGSNDLSIYGSSVQLLSVSEDGQTLNAVTNSKLLLRSVNGGQVWNPMGTIDLSNYGAKITAIGGDAFTAMGYGGVFLSEDGGQRWSPLALPAEVKDSTLYDSRLRRIDAQTLLLADSTGGTYLTHDRGANWRVLAPSSADFSATAAFSDATHGFMVDGKGRSLATADGGLTWQVKRTDFGPVRSLQFVNKQLGWLVGSDNLLHKSTDGGETWLTSPVDAGAYYYNVSFDNDKVGWSRRYVAPTVELVITQDGGQSWAVQNLPNSVVSMRLGEDAWVAGGASGEIYVSRDKGVTWKAVFSGTGAYFYDMTSSDAKTFWAVCHDGTLLKSEDAGATWTASKPAGANTLRSIRFANAKVGWIVGDNGLTLATVDGGKTWRTQASGTSATLWRVQIIDTSTAWITGEAGLLLATGNGGN